MSDLFGSDSDSSSVDNGVLDDGTSDSSTRLNDGVLIPRALAEEEQVSNDKRFHNILVCLDGSQISEKALPHAVAMARTCGASLSLVHVQEPPARAEGCTPTGVLDWEVARAQVQDYLERQTARLAETHLDVRPIWLQGSAAEQILQHAEDVQADLIVLTGHGERGLTDWCLGSTAEKVVSRSSTSVLVVPAAWQPPEGLHEVEYRRIQVPLDALARTEHVFPIVSALAKSSHGTVILVHVVEPPRLTASMPPSADDLELVRQLVHRNERVARQYVDRMWARLLAESIDVFGIVKHGEGVPQNLVDIAEQERADLVVLQARGKHGPRVRDYGEVTARLLSCGRMPLLLLRDRPPGGLAVRSAAQTARAQEPGRQPFVFEPKSPK